MTTKKVVRLWDLLVHRYLLLTIGSHHTIMYKICLYGDCLKFVWWHAVFLLLVTSSDLVTRAILDFTHTSINESKIVVCTTVRAHAVLAAAAGCM
jgi:hypothetical protein